MNLPLNLLVLWLLAICSLTAVERGTNWLKAYTYYDWFGEADERHGAPVPCEGGLDFTMMTAAAELPPLLWDRVGRVSRRNLSHYCTVRRYVPCNYVVAFVLWIFLCFYHLSGYGRVREGGGELKYWNHPGCPKKRSPPGLKHGAMPLSAQLSKTKSWPLSQVSQPVPNVKNH